MNLYVGNLSLQVMEEDLNRLFSPFGTVRTITIMRDRYSGESRGFGFVEMATRSEGLAAMSGLATTQLYGQHFTINEARPRSDQRGRSQRGR
jgi:RNA recognition motif-containing protein